MAFVWEPESSSRGLDERSSLTARSDRRADQPDLVSVYSPSLERFPKETIECPSLSSFFTYLIGQCPGVYNL